MAPRKARRIAKKGDSQMYTEDIGIRPHLLSATAHPLNSDMTGLRVPIPLIVAEDYHYILARVPEFVEVLWMVVEHDWLCLIWRL